MEGAPASGGPPEEQLSDGLPGRIPNPENPAEPRHHVTRLKVTPELRAQHPQLAEVLDDEEVIAIVGLRKPDEVMVFTGEQWAALMYGMKSGDYDDMDSPDEDN